MAMIEGMLKELDQEAQTTRRVLERVPENQLAWRPHQKARTLGELALHVAMVPGAVAELISSPSPAQVPTFIDPSPNSASELIPALDQSIGKAKRVLSGMDDAALMSTWRLMQGERELFAVPRVALLRSIMLNHWYHHRGQLSVYLRELDVPIPSITAPARTRTRSPDRCVLKQFPFVSHVRLRADRDLGPAKAGHYVPLKSAYEAGRYVQTKS